MYKEKIVMKNKFLALVVGAALVLAACGQIPGDTADADPGPNPTTTVPTTAPTTTPPSATAPTTAPPTTTGGGAVTTTVPPTTTTIPVATTSAPSADAVEVLVYVFAPHDPDNDATWECGDVTPVKRVVDSPEILTGAFEALVAGLTAEELRAGYGSWFSPETGWGIESVTVADGIARINFTEDSPPIPNASTSCGAMALMGQLNSTAMQFPTVDRVVYSFGGNVDAFYGWLQADSPTY
jgi:hypothetical protein